MPTQPEVNDDTRVLDQLDRIEDLLTVNSETLRSLAATVVKVSTALALIAERVADAK